MKRLVSRFFAAFTCFAAAWASASAADMTVRDIRALSRAEVEQSRPVVIEATVTYYRPQAHYLFVQDGKYGIFIETTTTQDLAVGDRLRIEGTTHWDFNANIVGKSITVVGHEALPKPAPARFDDLIQGNLDASLVKVRGKVRAADLNLIQGNEKPTATLRILTEGGKIDAEVMGVNEQDLKQLLDAEIEITGVDGARFDGKKQMTGVLLRVSSPDDVKILKGAALDPWSIPLTPVDQILHFFKEPSETRRVRVAGTATYFEPGSALVLQNGNKSLWIKTNNRGPVRIGDWVEATGFPNTDNGLLVLTGSEIQDTGKVAAIQPLHVTSKILTEGKHVHDLISIDGDVVTETRELSQDEYVLRADGRMFSVIYPHSSAMVPLPPMKDIRAGARIRATGICVTNDTTPLNDDVPFNLLIRSTEDLQVLAPPSILTVKNLALLVVVLLVLILLVGARALWIGRNMRSQLAELGYLSQRRGEILEDINRSRPLDEILERITELASASLKGAPCWCTLTSGSTVGNCLADRNTTGLRTVEVPMASHSGGGHGSIYAAFAASTKNRSDEQKALEAAASLATVAIETFRMHSDLVHRSEFDILTEIKNRFAFEQHLAVLIDEANRNGGMFGLIYIDLNDFKLVNDMHGHQVGDLFLQKVAERMKHQLRTSDMLARLGGDEFGVLVTVLHNRNEAEVIALRLERCFDEAFKVQNHIVRGSASIGIALYPTDATTDDGLMSIADSAMYERKRLKHRLREKRVGEASPSVAR